VRQAQKRIEGGGIKVSTLERAIAIAAEAHAGQVDKAGAPYVLHPLRMMLSMSSIDERIVAALHDVCEDCPRWTLDRLRSGGFSNRIIDAVRSVTRRDAEDYDDFVRRSAANPIGRRVKLADLHDNSDLSRIAVPTERDLQRIEKYRRAIDLIGRISA
jgi:(p)ppGpp synthase/HD superfamily hydrolase